MGYGVTNSLPYTGTDGLATFVVAAVLIVLAGILLRRLSSR